MSQKSARIQKKIDKANELAMQYDPPMNWYSPDLTEEEIDKYIFQFESYLEERDYLNEHVDSFTKKDCLEFLEDNSWYIEKSDAKKMPIDELRRLIVMRF